MALKKREPLKPKIETIARIKVVGVGGSGHNAIHRMINFGLSGVEFLAVNSDAQALHHSRADRKVQIGKQATRGLGAGMNPDTGRAAAEEDIEEIKEALAGADMVFITCGLGGGTGSGAGPVVAEVAKEAGILTVAVVTKPFAFEGIRRREIAEKALEELRENVDAIIVIPNDRVLQIIDKKTSLLDAFRTVDDVLRQGVQGIADLVTMPGLINVDFADVKSIMADSGSALMGIGKGSGENRAVEAAKQAIDSPLLELSIDGAKGVLFNVTGGKDLGMYEVDEAAKIITKSVDSDAKIIFGSVIDDSLSDEIRITVIATGFDEIARKKPSPKSVMAPISFDEEVKEAETSGSGFTAKSIETDDFEEEETEELDIPAFIRKKMK